ncbi:MAG: hypothetical protein ABIP80_07235 [Ferruginibacter sp.]
MKQLKFLLALCTHTCITINVHAQDCAVDLAALKGRYEGGCDKGKAHGQGKAFGYDSYEGEFKKGLPDGIGKYGWKNQNFYMGNMKKGLRDGKGEMHFMTISMADSSVSGFWKKDKYLGSYEKAYEIKAMTSRVSKINCRLSDKHGEDINFNVSAITSGVFTISDISIITGTYYRKNLQSLTNSSVTRIQQVTFPFRAIFTFNNGETTEIIFNEKGDYDVDVQLM